MNHQLSHEEILNQLTKLKADKHLHSTEEYTEKLLYLKDQLENNIIYNTEKNIKEDNIINKVVSFLNI